MRGKQCDVVAARSGSTESGVCRMHKQNQSERGRGLLFVWDGEIASLCSALADYRKAISIREKGNGI